MSIFTFTLSLLLLATTGAAQTDNPMFWLLIGPAPFAVVFAGLVLFRHGLAQNKTAAPGETEQIIHVNARTRQETGVIRSATSKRF
jgi:hypothetical protein